MSGPGPCPPAAASLFGERLPLAERYVELLAGPGVERGLIGPRETERLWDRHVLNSAVVAELIPDGVTVADVGSGAGLPGIPLALARPDLRIVLVEPMIRRTVFLDHVVTVLGLTEQITVRRARAGEQAAGAGYDLVVARAVAPLVRLVPAVLPMLRAGGRLLALKGRTVAAELAVLTDVVVEVRHAGVEHLETPTTVVVVTRPSGQSPARRRSGRVPDRRSRQEAS